MTDCPDKLTPGTSLIVTLHIYFLPAAFRPLETPETGDVPKPMFGEGTETIDERLVSIFE